MITASTVMLIKIVQGARHTEIPVGAMWVTAIIADIVIVAIVATAL